MSHTSHLAKYLATGLESWSPDTESVVSASRHLDHKSKVKLASTEPLIRGTALGKLYEVICYDRIVHLADNTELANSVITKGVYVPRKANKGPAMGQDGFFYSGGNLYVRGNGQDIAEVDAVVIGADREVVLCEVTRAGIDREKITLETQYKKLVFKTLLDSPLVSFLLVSQSSPAVSAIHSFTEEADNYYAKVRADRIPEPNFFQRIPAVTEQAESPKLVDARTLHTRELNYLATHNEFKSRAIDAALNTKPLKLILDHASSSIVKNVIIGALDLNTVKSLLDRMTINIPPVSHHLTLFEAEANFDKAVLGLSMPDLRPIIYLRQIKHRNYLKFGPAAIDRFGFERNIQSHLTGLFEWLETVEDYVDGAVTKRVLDYYLRPEVLGLRNVRHQKPRL